jgi:hypothetical protein
MDSYLKKDQLDRINRIVRILRPSAEGPLAAGEKIPLILLILSKKLDSNPFHILSTT